MAKGGALDALARQSPMGGLGSAVSVSPDAPPVAAVREQEVRLEGRGGEPREALDGDWAEAVQGPDPKRAQPLLHAVDRQVHVGGDRVAARADGGQPQQPARAPRRRLLARRRLLVTLRLPRGGLASIEAVQSPSVRKRARSAVRLSLKRLC
eukprot:1141931-Pleurochrysis_carterae.AAC.1